MRLQSERGAVFIHVGIGLLALLMFGAFAIDYGILWTSRGQAQNAADAGALAGVGAISFDNIAGHDKWDRGREVAWHTAHRHAVWGDQSAVIEVTSPYDGTDVPGRTVALCEDQPESCLKVQVYRNSAHSAAMPTFLANLFGTSSQGVRAMAVAQTAPASGTTCMKPWLIPDRWDDANGNGVFDTGETYTAPTKNEDGTINPGTGWQPSDIGTELTLKAGNPQQAISPSDFYEIEDANLYEPAITGCVITKNIGDDINVLNGNRVGPTNHGIDDLLLMYPEGATVVIGMFSPAAFWAMDRQSGNFDLTITNMLAFKIDHRNGNQVVGTIVGAPSTLLSVCNTPPCPVSSGLIQVLRLVR
jgi:hypothetical protein